MADFNILNSPENLTMTDMLAKVPTGLAKSCRFAVRFLPGGGPNNRLAGSGFTAIMAILPTYVKLRNYLDDHLLASI